MHPSNSHLIVSFPAALRDDASVALSVFPECPPHQPGSFSVRIADETVFLPYRIYHDPVLIHTETITSLQKELVNCLLTRHTDGFIRQEYLSRIIHSRNFWVPPFVIQLAGEYVIQILQVIRQNLENLDRAIYRELLKANPEFLAVTAQRIESYWNYYYRSYRRTEYVGFQLMDFFKSLLADNR